MVECPICGLGERCHNHWVAVQEPGGEVEFQAGPMTASEDNLVLLRNKLKNPPLRELFEQLGLHPAWQQDQGRLLAYLEWPLELRGSVHRNLFPGGQPGAAPLAPTPVYRDRVEDFALAGVELDAVNCLPDEVVYKVELAVKLEKAGPVRFYYMQSVWADGLEWAPLLATPGVAQQAEMLVRLLIGGLLDPLRVQFAGQEVDVLADDQPDGIAAGSRVDEIAMPGPPERHLGEEIERAINERRLQPLLRDGLLRLATPSVVH